MHTLEEVREAALRLPLDEQITLAEELYSIGDGPPGVREEDLTAVLAARIAQVENGEVELIDGPTALAEIREELAFGRKILERAAAYDRGETVAYDREEAIELTRASLEKKIW